MAQSAIGGGVYKPDIVLKPEDLKKMSMVELKYIGKLMKIVIPPTLPGKGKKDINTTVDMASTYLSSRLPEEGIRLKYEELMDVKLDYGKFKIDFKTQKLPAYIEANNKIKKLEEESIRKDLERKGMEIEMMRIKEREMREEIDKLGGELDKVKPDDRETIENLTNQRTKLITKLSEMTGLKGASTALGETLKQDEVVKVVKKDFVDKSIEDKMSSDLTKVPDYWKNPYAKKEPTPKPKPKKTFSEEKKEERAKEMKEEKELLKEMKILLKDAKTEKEYEAIIENIKQIVGRQNYLKELTEGKETQIKKGRSVEYVEGTIKEQKTAIKELEEDKAKRFQSLLMHPVDREETQRQDLIFKQKTGEKNDGVDDALRYPVVKGEEAKKKKSEDQMTSKSNGLNLEARITNMRKFQSMRDNVIKKSALKSGYVSTDAKMKMLKRSIF